MVGILELANQFLVILFAITLGQLPDVQKVGALQRLENVVNVVQTKEVTSGYIAVLFAFCDDGEVEFGKNFLCLFEIRELL